MANGACMWTQDESGRVHTPLEPVVLAATLALFPVLIIESDATSEGWQRFAEVANWAIWAVFAFELAAVLIVAPRKRAALRAHWLDVAIVVLTIPLLGQALSWLRLARFVRLARFGAVAGRALQAERRLTSGEKFRGPDRHDLRLRDDHHWTWIRGLTFETLKTVMSQDSPVLSRNYPLRDVEESL